MPEGACAAIVLAAGASTRLGCPKQLLHIDGESLLRRTVRITLGAGCRPVLVVLGYEAERMTPELSGLDVHSIIHSGWQAGMGSSLGCGMRELLHMDAAADSVMVVVCDQIRLSSKLLFHLIEVHNSSKLPVSAARYAGRLGTPAIFSRALFLELLELEGDKGARGLIEQRHDQTAVVDFPEGVDDVDTPQDIERLL